MDWTFLTSLIDASKLGGWVRAAVASLLGAALAKWPALSAFLTPEAQTALGIVAASIVVGVWSHIAKKLKETPVPNTSSVPKSLIAFFVIAGAAAFALSFSAPAMAQPKAPTKQITTTQAQQNPLTILQGFTQADLQAALADAQGQTPPDTIAANCYAALLALTNNPANPLSLPKGVFSTLQKVRDAKALLLNLQSPNGPLSNLNVACAPLLVDANTTLLQLGIVTGVVAGKAAFPLLP